MLIFLYEKSLLLNCCSLRPLLITDTISDGSGTWNKILGHPKSSKKWNLGKLKKAFFNFLPFFIAVPPSNMPKIWQNMKKSLVQFALNPFLHDTSNTRSITSYLSQSPIGRQGEIAKQELFLAGLLWHSVALLLYLSM